VGCRLAVGRASDRCLDSVEGYSLEVPHWFEFNVMHLTTLATITRSIKAPPQWNSCSQSASPCNPTITASVKDIYVWAYLRTARLSALEDGEATNVKFNNGGALNALVAGEYTSSLNSVAYVKNSSSRSLLILVVLVLFGGTLRRGAALCFLELPQEAFQVIRKGHVFHCGVIFLQMAADTGPQLAVRRFVARGKLIGWHCFGPSRHDANLGPA
jgi:hypothetical protein